MVSEFSPLAFIGGLGATELIIILVIVLVIFGANKLPQLGEALGKGIKNFRSATTGAAEDEDEDSKEPHQLPAKSSAGGEAVEDVEARDVTSSKK